MGNKGRRAAGVVAVLALSLMGTQLINNSRAAATLPAARGAGGVSLRTNKTMKPVRLDMSKVARTAGSNVVPASVAPLSSFSPACYGDSKSMTPVGGTFDPISYGAFYNCSKQDWTFEVQTEDAWAKNSLGSWQIGIDTDGDFTDDCGGAEYVGYVAQTETAGQFVASIYLTDSNCDAIDPATASIYITGNTVAISFPASDIGNNPSLAWNGFIQSRSEEEMETQPGQDVPNPNAIDGPLTGGVLDSIPGPVNCSDITSSSTTEVATTSKGNDSKLAAALRKTGFSHVRDYGVGVVSFRGDPTDAGRVLAKDRITSHIARSVPYTTESVGSLDGSTTSPPDDPDYSSQWNLPVVNAPGAWSVTTGNNIVVADVDTGADYTQTDLAANLVDGYDETTLLPMGPGTTETGDTDTGQTDSGHGTAVAGVIAGVTNNDLGLASLGWNTRVMPIKVDFDNSDDISAQIVAGIDWAADTALHPTDPVKVINLSFGGTCPDSNVAAAIQAAQAPTVSNPDGILVVAAAGNDALSAGFDLTPDDDQFNDAPVYPASDPNVISVGATGREGYRAAYSNVGDESLVAPGGSADFDMSSGEVTANDMLSLNAGGGTTTGAGTSFAAPEVAATAALILSVNPNLTSTQVSELIESTATGLGPSGTNIEYGQGMLNAGAAVSDAPPTTTGFGTYVAVPPVRILDTRNAIGAPKEPIGPAHTLTFKVTGAGGAQGVPSTGVAAVVINTTVVNPTAASYLTVWPTGQQQPYTSSINFTKGQVVPNLVTVKVGAGGDISFYNSAGSTDLVADLAGYYVDGTGTAGSTFVSVAPVRLLDTRQSTPIGSGLFRNLLVTGSNGVPSTATGVVLNVTVTQPTAAGWVTVYPAGETTPVASNLNFTKGETVANLAIVQLGTEGDSMGSISLYNRAGLSDVIVDLEGYLTAAGDTSGSRFFPLVDHRIVDTRGNVGGFDAPVGAGQPGVIAANIVGHGGVLVGPSGTIGNSDGPSAVVMNVTVTGGTIGGYLTVYPAGETAPVASNLNFTKGDTVANLATTTIGTSGQDDIFNQMGTVEVICDVVGYYGAPGT